MRVVASLVSDIKKVLKKDLEDRGTAQVRGLMYAADGLKYDLRDAAEGAGLGRLGKAYDWEVYPGKRHKGGSLRASAVIYVKGGQHTQDAIHAFTHGATVRSKNGLFLLIPTENAPKIGARGRGVGGRDKARDHLLAAAEARYGKLRFVYRRGKTSMLVADNVRAHTGARTGFMRASKRSVAAGHTATIVVFFLVPMARLRKRYDPMPLERKWRAYLPQLISIEYGKLSGSNRG